MEALIRKRLVEDPVIQSQLATFYGQPAVFQRQAPSDTDSGWDGPQYPRIDFVVDRQENPERKVQGVASFNIWALTTSQARPNDIERRIRELLDGAFFHPEGQDTTALRWSQSDMFEAGNDNELIIGITVLFDLLAFPLQTTFSPDPILALNEWAESKFSVLQVDPETWTPADSNSALYWRLAGITGIEMLNWGAWVTATIAGHVLAPSPIPRLEWTRRLTEALALERRVKLDDGSQMSILSISADSTSDPLTTGQIQLSIRYGVLTPAEVFDPLNVAYVKTTDGAGGVVKK